MPSRATMLPAALVAFVVGVIALQQCATLPPERLLWALAGAAAGVLVGLRRTANEKARNGHDPPPSSARGRGPG